MRHNFGISTYSLTDRPSQFGVFKPKYSMHVSTASLKQLCYVLPSEQSIFPNLGGQVHYLLQNVLAARKVLLVSALSPLSGNPVTEFKLLSDLFGTFQLSLLSQSLYQSPVRKME